MIYENYLFGELSRLNTFDLKIEVSEEQMFAKKTKLDDDTCYVVVKHLASTITYEGNTEPIQIMIMSESNSLDKVMSLFNTFTTTHNWSLINAEGYVAKQQYATPVVVSNFNDIANGYRSLLYVSGTLFVMQSVLDAKDITLNGIPLKVSGFTYSYNMSPNTQQKPNDYISSSVKSNSVVAVNFAIPMQDIFVATTGTTQSWTRTSSQTMQITASKEWYQDVEFTGTHVNILSVTDNGNTAIVVYEFEEGQTTGLITGTFKFNLIKALLTEMSGRSNGNLDFTLSFSVNGISFSHTMKLTSAQFTTAPDSMPTIQVGLTR